GPPVLAVEVHGVQPFAHLGGDLGGQLAQPRERQGRGRRGGVRPGRPDVVGGGHGLLLRWMRSGRGRRGPARPAGLPRRQLTIIPTGIVGSECIGCRSDVRSALSAADPGLFPTFLLDKLDLRAQGGSASPAARIRSTRGLGRPVPAWTPALSGGGGGCAGSPPPAPRGAAAPEGAAPRPLRRIRRAPVRTRSARTRPARRTRAAPTPKHAERKDAGPWH